MFHRAGRTDESLSEQQIVDDQLRYYTNKRVLRGLRYIALDYAKKLEKPIVLRLSSLPITPDSEFIGWLISQGKFGIEVTQLQDRNEGTVDSISEKINRVIGRIKDNSITTNELVNYLRQLLNYGDSWSAKLVANAYLESADELDNNLAGTLGIPYALQGEPGMAKVLWEAWLQTSKINEARACYSLAMLCARHNPRSLIDLVAAEKYLELGWRKLEELEPSSQISYEKVFNRNGIALLLFRAKKYAEARDVLEKGIASLRSSAYTGKLHHTVLTSNLARVVTEMRDYQEAEHLLRETIDMDPLFAEYHQDLASFLCDRERFEEAKTEAERTIECDPSMPEAHRLLGFIHMQLGDPIQARGAYMRAIDLGDDEAILDALRAAYEDGTPEWIIEVSSKIPLVNLDMESQAEAELIILQAKATLDPNMDIWASLSDLHKRFPGDELIAKAIRLNTKMEQ